MGNALTLSVSGTPCHMRWGDTLRKVWLEWIQRCFSPSRNARAVGRPEKLQGESQEKKRCYSAELPAAGRGEGVWHARLNRRLDKKLQVLPHPQPGRLTGVGLGKVCHSPLF